MNARAKHGVLTPLAAVADAPTVPLSELAPQAVARVCHIDAKAAGQPAERVRQLADLGFVAGEPVTVLTRAWPGGDPLVVLVGHSRFALRRAEAACVQVRPVD